MRAAVARRLELSLLSSPLSKSESLHASPLKSRGDKELAFTVPRLESDGVRHPLDQRNRSQLSSHAISYAGTRGFFSRSVFYRQSNSSIRVRRVALCRKKSMMFG